MTTRVCIGAGQAGGLEMEAQARIEALGLEPLLLPADSSAAATQATLARCAMLVSLYPAAASAHLGLGLAAGMGLPIFVLAATRDLEPFPRGTRVFTSLQALIDALPTGDAGRHIDEPLLNRLGACKEGVDWYLRRYPGGRHSSEWTIDEQLQSLADGGAPWLKTAFDYRLIPQHAMDGADLAGADLSGLRLRGASLKGLKAAGADLSGGQLIGVNLAGADLTGADLTGTTFRRCDLTEAAASAILEQATLERCEMAGLGADKARMAGMRVSGGAATGAVFSNANLAGAVFSGADLTEADFSGADLSGVQFQSCTLKGAAFGGANLKGAGLLNCDLTGVGRGAAEFAQAYIHP